MDSRFRQGVGNIAVVLGDQTPGHQSMVSWEPFTSSTTDFYEVAGVKRKDVRMVLYQNKAPYKKKFQLAHWTKSLL